MESFWSICRTELRRKPLHLSPSKMTTLGCTIVSIRTDHGREFDNEVQFGEFCNANGNTHNFSAPRTPQSNGMVERKNRTLQKMSRTILNEQSLPQNFFEVWEMSRIVPKGVRDNESIKGDGGLVVGPGNGYLRKGQNRSQKRQNQARERKEREAKVKSKPKIQSQPREVDSERASKIEPENVNCQKWAYPYPPSGPRNLNDVRDDVSNIDTLAIHGNHWGMIAWTYPRAKMDLKKHKDELKVKIEADISSHTRKPGQGSKSF
ncbi:retrovirus-related pol polyprotein from transposon TNT 1-94 [Tanacetum coccineum]